ncbi:hypothetical protein [Ancylobacter rudongensis]|uniref:Uncharacterized protein n=1 Tax=Ancylobacter rudongensis TaxID=177413 RepID=A0A1G4UQL6_9HYPH|nr:hypothetical protein [Ancylobacter rudongensis]SCW95933.1 hypothetical protein SAMN05660859_0151 [Ancylobacter rudongensis]
MTHLQLTFLLAISFAIAVVIAAQLGTANIDCVREPGVPYRWAACVSELD